MQNAELPFSAYIIIIIIIINLLHFMARSWKMKLHVCINSIDHNLYLTKEKGSFRLKSLFQEWPDQGDSKIQSYRSTYNNDKTTAAVTHYS